MERASPCLHWLGELRLASRVSSWLIFRYPEAPVSLWNYPNNVVFGELPEFIEERLFENKITLAVFSQKIICLRFHQEINDVILIEAFLLLQF